MYANWPVIIVLPPQGGGRKLFVVVVIVMQLAYQLTADEQGQPKTPYIE